MIAKIADSGDNEMARVDAIFETGMTIGRDGLTRVAYICGVCGARHGAHEIQARKADLRRVCDCDLCGAYSYLLYPVHCWGGLRGGMTYASGAADDTESHYGMADAARTATAGHSTQQAARSCDESAKPGTPIFDPKRVARLQRTLAENCEALAKGLPALNVLQVGRFRDQANVEVVAKVLGAVAEDLLIAATRNDLS